MKPYTVIAVVVFWIVSLLHVLRLFFHLQIIVNSMIVPQWVSVPVFVIAGAFAFMLMQESKK